MDCNSVIIEMFVHPNATNTAVSHRHRIVSNFIAIVSWGNTNDQGGRYPSHLYNICSAVNTRRFGTKVPCAFYLGN